MPIHCFFYCGRKFQNRKNTILPAPNRNFEMDGWIDLFLLTTDDF